MYIPYYENRLQKGQWFFNFYSYMLKQLDKKEKDIQFDLLREARIARKQCQILKTQFTERNKHDAAAIDMMTEEEAFDVMETQLALARDTARFWQAMLEGVSDSLGIHGHILINLRYVEEMNITFLTSYLEAARNSGKARGWLITCTKEIRERVTTYIFNWMFDIVDEWGMSNAALPAKTAFTLSQLNISRPPDRKHVNTLAQVMRNDYGPEWYNELIFRAASEVCNRVGNNDFSSGGRNVRQELLKEYSEELKGFQSLSSDDLRLSMVRNEMNSFDEFHKFIITDSAKSILETSGLSPQEFKVLQMRIFEDMTETEVAENLGRTVGTVRQHQARGYKKIRLRRHELNA